MLGNRLTRASFERTLETSGRSLQFSREPAAEIELATAFALQTVARVLAGDGRSEDSPARAGWLASGAIGCIAERAAALPVSEAEARATLRAAAQEITHEVIVRERGAAGGSEPDTDIPVPLFVSMRERVSRSSPSIFCDWVCDAAEAYGDAPAAQQTFATLAALVEGIKIIDDIQDREPRCLAADVGAGRALNLALGALAWALELTADLELPDDGSWRAAARTIGRGIRETAIGQDLETAATGDFAMFWEIVDRKTSPLVATSFELGALVAGAGPARAAALTRLAVPYGRILQIGDDCNDALGPDASDWRTPRLNLLMLYALSGPHGAELDALLQRGDDAAALQAAKVWLLRDGALAYAIHAQLTTIAAAAETIQSLALPNPAPFHESLERRRAECELLLSKSGVDADLAASVAGV